MPETSLVWPYSRAFLGGITSLRLWRKGNCEAQTSWHCLETELNTCAKIQAEFSTHLETALSKMSLTLRSKSHTSDTGITPPSELGRLERVSSRATLKWEVSCSVLSGMGCSTNTSLKIWERLISLSFGRSQGDVIRWSRGPESKVCRVQKEY